MKKLILPLSILILFITLMTWFAGSDIHHSEIKSGKGVFIKSIHYYVNDKYLYIGDSNGISETRLIDKGYNYDVVYFKLGNDTLQIKKSCLIGGNNVKLHDSVSIGYREFLDGERVICKEIISVGRLK